MNAQQRLTIDGAQGEGGGQIIRSSLGLAAVTGQPVRLENIRAGRERPGLLRQHLTAVNAAAAVCGADIDGAELSSRHLDFTPGVIRGGDFQFSVGTAGSTSLVTQTVLPALARADKPSTVRLSGGTHNPFAPPLDFFTQCYLPLLAKMGPVVETRRIRYGFYPAGGGEIELSIAPAGQLRAIELTEVEDAFRAKVTAIVSNLPRGIAQRQCDTIKRKSNWRDAEYNVIEVDDPVGPGNVVMIELQRDTVNELFIGHGTLGIRAEHVARGVLKQARAHLARRVPVGEYLADQLMLPMALAAAQGQTSRFRTGPLSLHSRTHLEILKHFLDLRIRVDCPDDQTVDVSIGPGRARRGESFRRNHS